MECFSNSEHVKKQQNGQKMSTLDGSKFNSEIVSKNRFEFLKITFPESKFLVT